MKKISIPRRLFALLAGLAVALTSWGFIRVPTASAATDSNVSVTFSPLPGTPKEQYGDYAIHSWGGGIAASDSTLTDSNSDGILEANLTIPDGATDFGFAIRKAEGGNDWAYQTQDILIPNTDSDWQVDVVQTAENRNWTVTIAPVDKPAPAMNLDVNFIPAEGKTIADYDMWVWSSDTDGRTVDFTSTTPEGWLNVVIDTAATDQPFTDPANLNVIVREGKAWGGWQTSDLAVASPSEVWIDAATPSIVSTTAPVDPSAAPTSVDITVHYVRYDDMYDGWNLWTWLPNQNGQRIDFDADHTATWTIEDPNGVTSVGLIVRKSTAENEWAQKNTGDDLYLTDFPDGKAEVWIVQGNSTIFTNPADIPDAPDLTCHNVHSDAFNEQYYYDGELGAIYTPAATTYRLWAPTAESVVFLDYTNGETPVRTDMTSGDRGTWELVRDGDELGTVYTYELTFADGKVNESVDPYARASTANSKRTVVVDVDNLNPVGWTGERMPAFSSIQDATIYEAHIRDLTIGAENGIENKGKFLGLTEVGTTTSSGNLSGLDYIDSLGVTHVQFLPMYDFGSVDETGDLSYGAQYNWGYDPMNYNVPEGSYSTDPSNPQSRIVEMKSMVDAIHGRDMYVVMDVVYNHVYNTATSPLELTVPNYYFRMDENCQPHNGTGVGNETASEQPMMRKYMVDSLTYWAETYNIDGFRFDLMGIHDVETMNQIRTALNEIDPSIVILGEGWAMGNHPEGVVGANQYNAGLLDGISFFNDSFRDTMKGDNFDLANRGFVNDGGTSGWDVWNNIIGGQHVRDYTAPYQSVAYNEAHDNYTMYDKLKGSMPEASEDEIVRRHALATSIQFLANGTNFVHAGQEFLRTKDGDHNSYKSPDSVNEFTYDRAADPQYAAAHEYFTELQQFRVDNEWLRVRTYEELNSAYVDPIIDGQHVSYRVMPSVLGLDGKDYRVFINASATPWTADLPAGDHDVLIRDMSVLDTPERVTSEGSIDVPALSVLVVQEREPAPVVDTSVTVEVSATWVDELGHPLHESLTPDMIRVDITNNSGKSQATLMVQKAGEWKSGTNPTAGVTPEGEPTTFTPVVEPVAGYSFDISVGEAVDGQVPVTITATKLNSAVTVSADTTYLDAAGQTLDSALIPTDVSVDVLDVDGLAVDTMALTEGIVSSDKLRRYDATGAEISYALSSPVVDGFDVVIGMATTDEGGNITYPVTLTALPTEVTAEAVTFNEESDTYTIPEVTGVTYLVDGQPVSAGTYPVTTPATITVTAEATDGYVLAPGTTNEWIHDYTTPVIEEPSEETERIAGKNRIQTSVAAAEKIAMDNGGLNSLVIAGFDGVPDVLAGTALADRLNTGIVYTNSEYLSTGVATLIKEQGISEVYILGGTQVVSNAVAQDLAELGVDVVRIGGKNRYRTATLIAEYVDASFGDIDSVVFATGMDFADALVAGPLVAKYDGVLILTRHDQVNADSKAFLAQHPHVAMYAVGGPGAQAASNAGYETVTTYTGKNRFATAANLVRAEFWDVDGVALANGRTGVDAAVAGAYAANKEIGVLLTDATSMSAYTANALSNFEYVKVFGGTVVISEQIYAGLIK